MKSFLILVLAVGCAVAAHDPGLRVKFAIGLKPGTDFFFDVPRTISQAVAERWRLTPRPEGPLPSLSLYCYLDFTVCVYMDDTGNVAGLQIALDKSEFTDNLYDMKVSGFKEWETTDIDGNVKQFWITTMYFASEEYLRLPAAEREANRNSSKFLQEDAAWVTGYNGVIDRVSVREPQLQNTPYTRQACIPWMGLHYYYKMTKNTECRADTLYPWFLLTDYQEVMGIGIKISGKITIKEGARDWFEHPFGLAVAAIVPNGPKCLYQEADNPGQITMHVYFVNKPWRVGCRLFGK